jgi:hypothetical protein
VRGGQIGGALGQHALPANLGTLAVQIFQTPPSPFPFTLSLLPFNAPARHLFQKKIIW